jgi:hypothetical protein
VGERERNLILWLADRMARHGDPFAKRTPLTLAVVLAISVVWTGLIAVVLVVTGGWSVRSGSPAAAVVSVFVAMFIGLPISVIVPWWKRKPPFEGDAQPIDGSGTSGGAPTP